MNNYIDSWGRIHHKPVTEENPIPSNNSWLYTAYAKKLGLPVDKKQLREAFNLCEIDVKLPRYQLIRNPGKDTPPISRDEILGMSSLGFLRPAHLESWNFSPFPLPKFSAVKLAKQLWELRPSFGLHTIPCLLMGKGDVIWKHRNYFWENNLDQIYRFAFSVPLQDRYFILNNWGKLQWWNPVHFFYRAVSFADRYSLTPSAIKWLKYGWESNKECMLEEFPADHPIKNV